LYFMLKIVFLMILKQASFIQGGQRPCDILGA
jgi:hypothetical protein